MLDGACTFTCSDNYEGGAVTCQADGTYAVEACYHKPAYTLSNTPHNINARFIASCDVNDDGNMDIFAPAYQDANYLLLGDGSDMLGLEHHR